MKGRFPDVNGARDPRARPKPGLRKKLRAAKKRRLDDLVLRNMRLVRLEDQYCRCPDPECQRTLNLEVAHLKHRGAGGNPNGDRSTPDLMILLSKARHKTSRISVDAGTLDIRPLTADGTRGAVAFWIDKRALTMSLAQLGAGEPEWVEIAREAWPHVIQWQDDGLIAELSRIR